jgi:pantoate--beta-alanine ligase
MKIAGTVKEVSQAVKKARLKGKSVGFVPTMGYLHKGHLSLVELARKKTDYLVVSIYVNPTQFSPNEDLDSYPRDPERDEKLLREAHTDLLFFPDNQIMYPSPYRTYVEVEEITRYLCGKSRPGHFRGVATIVAKLFNIVRPDISVFGEKDFQQLAVIRQMVKDLNFPVEIIGGPIIRENDGLAMSSRNKYLSPDERGEAVILYQSLLKATEMFRNGERSAKEIKEVMSGMISGKEHARIDYIEIVDSQTLEPKDFLDSNTRIALAVFFGKTRLIDNMAVTG